VSLVPIEQRKYRKQVPKEHQHSLDTRIRWLWNQRWGTVQMVWKESRDMLDVTAATLLLQAVMAKDLDSIEQIFQRLEGGALTDEELLDREDEATLRI
jgi:hypothetical protein